MAANNLNVTELDFDQIKQNLKNYLKTQAEFNDYDFNGSGLSVLLDVLSYNTHYNAMVAHFALNEAFLDSAQIRGNVVTRAKLLGYTPRSILAPRATVTITVDVSDEVGTIPGNLTVSRGTKLTTNVDGQEYTYTVLEAMTAAYDALLQNFVFPNVFSAQGIYKTVQYRVDNDIENQKFQLLDQTADTSTARVRVRQNQESSRYDIYTRFDTIQNIKSDSQVYHLQENSAGYYEVYFGDGIIGKKPIDNNVINIDYVVTDGTESNGANVFTVVNNIGGFAAISVATNTAASGGAIRETSESIRFNAPLTFIAQNRAVTSDDYRAIIQKNFANIESISTWGGEDNDPPDYGTVYLSIKPLVGTSITQEEKTEITLNILKGKNVVSILPKIVDPDFTSLELDVFFKYNPNLTDRTKVEIESLVRDTIADYNYNNLNKFDGVFRHSALLRAIDNADSSVTSSTVRPYMFKNISAGTTVGVNNFELNYAGTFLANDSTTAYSITSSAFKIPGSTEDHFFGDLPIAGESNRKVIVYKVVNGIKIIVLNDCGTVYINTGKIVLNSFACTTATTIRIMITPDSLDIAPKRNQLINIDSTRLNVTASVDRIALSGSTGTISYTTTSRMRS
jgi:hypothetical protein